MPPRGPSRFGWIVPDRLAGSGRPGRFAPLSEDLDFLRQEGIGVILSLLESTTNLPEYRAEGFDAHHFPVVDFTAPEIDQIKEACAVIDQAVKQGKKVLVHCNAGIGRTGTILACYLVHQGMAPHEAIRRVRQERPLSLETGEQMAVVDRYHRLLGVS